MQFDINFLSECFDVDYLNGVLKWKISRPKEHFPTHRGWINWHNKNPGKVAGYVDANGYMGVKMTLGGVEYNLKEHRIIYAMFHEDPEPPFIDHYDGDTTNNCISNLRPCTKKQNARNRKVSVKNKSGITGVRRVAHRPNLWIASVIVDGKNLTKTSNDFFEVCCFRKSWEVKLSIRIRD